MKKIIIKSKKENLLKHLFKRVFIFVLLMFISIFIGLSTLNLSRRCGTGDGLAIIPWVLIFYLFWSIYLSFEIFNFHKKKQIVKRNSNLIMMLFLPISFFYFGFILNF